MAARRRPAPGDEIENVGAAMPVSDNCGSVVIKLISNNMATLHCRNVGMEKWNVKRNDENRLHLESDDVGWLVGGGGDIAAPYCLRHSANAASHRPRRLQRALMASIINGTRQAFCGSNAEK